MCWKNHKKISAVYKLPLQILLGKTLDSLNRSHRSFINFTTHTWCSPALNKANFSTSSLNLHRTRCNMANFMDNDENRLSEFTGDTEQS